MSNILWTKIPIEECIKHFREKHGNKYDYSLVKCIEPHKNIKIICPLHGLFEQNYKNHYNSKDGCQKCSNEQRRSSITNYIEQFKNIHGDKYDYSLNTEYNKKIKIICPIHGLFEQRITTHLKSGCKKCSNTKIMTPEEFKKQANIIHKYRYDYSFVTNIHRYTQILKINCPIHGEFKQMLSSHLRGNGCKKCQHESMKIEINTIIERCLEKHKDKNIDFNKTIVGIQLNKPIKFYCREHGFFESLIHNFLSSNNPCPECSIESDRKASFNSFVDRANKRFHNRYKYIENSYRGMNYYMLIECSKHGIFEQLPCVHLRSTGCSACIGSLGELSIYNYFQKHNIEFNYQYSFSDCRGRKAPLIFDFYLKKYNLCIEFDGEQHNVAKRMFGGEEGLKRIQEYDSIKNKYCLEKGIDLLRISFKDYNNIDNILSYIC